MKMLSLGADFMAGYWRHEIEIMDGGPGFPLDCEELYDGVTFAYAGNMAGDQPQWARKVQAECRARGIPTVWQTIEDPNSFETFFYQAEGADVIATSDRELIPRYERYFPGKKVIWLPLAAQPAIHFPVRGIEPVADTILIANYYLGAERMEQVRIAVEPIVDAGISLRLYASGDFNGGWPAKYAPSWHGATGYGDVRMYYPEGRIALGINNQMHGTAMCSMRMFEILACGRPMVAAHSDAFEALGFVNGEHFVWVKTPEEAVAAVRRLLAEPEEAAEMALRGRQFVETHHCYSNRLRTILDAIGVAA